MKPVGRRFEGGNEGGADPDPAGAQRQRGRQTPSIGDSSRRRYQSRCYGIDDLPRQSQRADPACMASAVLALRDDYLDASVSHSSGVLEVSHYGIFDSVNARGQLVAPLSFN